MGTERSFSQHLVIVAMWPVYTLMHVSVYWCIQVVDCTSITEASLHKPGPTCSIRLPWVTGNVDTLFLAHEYTEHTYLAC